jgi:hypothetical protein
MVVLLSSQYPCHKIRLEDRFRIRISTLISSSTLAMCFPKCPLLEKRPEYLTTRSSHAIIYLSGRPDKYQLVAFYSKLSKFINRGRSAWT